MILFLKTAFKKFIAAKKLNSQTLKKINIGAGPDGASPEYSNWVCVDKDILDITRESDWLKIVNNFNALDNILAEHVWEHLNDEDTRLANLNCFKFLKPGGKLRLAVPDGFNVDKEYVERVKPGGSGDGSSDHKLLYNYKIMIERLSAAGFEVDLVEYWDELGQFHAKDWKMEDGFIKRSKKYDSRNQQGKLGYTSLIVDAVKK